MAVSQSARSRFPVLTIITRPLHKICINSKPFIRWSQVWGLSAGDTLEINDIPGLSALCRT